MAVQLVSKGSTIREQVSAEEWRARVELAAGHRVLAHYGVNDMTYNHFGLRVPDEPDAMLIKRTDWMFNEVTASSLLKVDFDGNVRTETDDEDDQGRRADHPCRAAARPGRPECHAAYAHAGRDGRVGAQMRAAADQPAGDAVLWRDEIP